MEPRCLREEPLVQHHACAQKAMLLKRTPLLSKETQSANEADRRFQRYAHKHTNMSTVSRTNPLTSTVTNTRTGARPGKHTALSATKHDGLTRNHHADTDDRERTIQLLDRVRPVPGHSAEEPSRNPSDAPSAGVTMSAAPPAATPSPTRRSICTQSRDEPNMSMASLAHAHY